MNNAVSQERFYALRSLGMMINVALEELENENKNIFNNDGTISEYAKRSNKIFTKLKLRTWTIVLFLRSYLDVSIMLYSNGKIDSIADIFKREKYKDMINLSNGGLHFLKVIIDGSNNIKHLKDDESHRVNPLSKDGFPSVWLTLHAYNDNFDPEKDSGGKIITYNRRQPIKDLVQGTNSFILKVFDTYKIST